MLLQGFKCLSNIYRMKLDGGFVGGFLEDVRGTIEKYNMLAEGDSVVVGVSGGFDSITLLHVLRALREDYSLRLYAVHLNHCFRGREADEDALYVEQTCREWDVPAFIETFDVPAYSRESGLSAEEAGREIRYRLFSEICRRVKADKIAVAQNQNDNVETILMRFMRGTGIDGLKGIEPVRDNIIRPLLEMSRDRIEAYCAENGLKPRTDRTNLETIYQRNKVRLELLPYIRDNFNPNILSTTVRFANIIKDENDYLESQALIAFNRIAEISENGIQYNMEGLKELHEALRRRTVRLGIERLAGSLTGFEFRNIENVLELTGKSTGAAVMLPGRLKAYVSYSRLILTKDIEKQYKKCYYKLKYGCTNIIQEAAAAITIEEKDIAELEEIKKSRYKAPADSPDVQTAVVFIDKSRIQSELVFRSREDGDIFSPIGMKGRKKLKDYFIDEKIPREQRDSIGLVADGKEIVWVVGRRLSDRYKITGETKNVLVIKYERGTYNE